ncbi:probable protein ABIL1 isoform X1 [Musa acuminata AAA Group]|uniref:probable protein ABIL1 isoform X1 n=1 Tax=Musa acuminata AAA Group TaxID=214697 RepID=UPI0031DB0585
MQQGRPELGAMTFDEVSLERSKGFVQALQELKNLRPQLYSAAEYCEKSYLRSEQKQMVVDNLKEYGVRALVNVVDHLGTVAYKLTDLSEQQSSDMATVEQKISCLCQQILACQAFTGEECLRQHQLFAATPRHLKHYTLPKFVGTSVESSSMLQNHINPSHVEAKPLPHTWAPKTLSWHLASGSNSSPNRDPPQTAFRVDDSKAFGMTADSCRVLVSGAEETTAPLPLSSYLQAAKRRPTINVASRTFAVKDPLEGTKTVAGFESSSDSGQREICQPPPRNKSILSALFPRNKTLKPKRLVVS